MSFEDMLDCHAVGSANDSCVAVAEHWRVHTRDFVDKMTKKPRYRPKG
jgi:D-alanyl-D-alanine carboxypeptidase